MFINLLSTADALIFSYLSIKPTCKALIQDVQCSANFLHLLGIVVYQFPPFCRTPFLRQLSFIYDTHMVSQTRISFLSLNSFILYFLK